MDIDVRKHASDFFNVLVLACLGILEVGGRCPVRGLVLADTARGAVSIKESSGVSDLAEAYRVLDGSLSGTLSPGVERTRRAEDGVGMGRDLAKVNNGVHARESDASRTLHAPKGMSAAHEAGRCGEQRLGEHRYVYPSSKLYLLISKEWNDATRLSGQRVSAA